MAGMIQADVLSAWRDRARYDRLAGFDRATWAWECLRRAMGEDCQIFRTTGHRILRSDPPLCVLTGAVQQPGGSEPLPLAVFNDAGVFTGHVVWCADSHAPVLKAHARSLPDDCSTGFNLRALRHPAIVLRPRGKGEHVLIADGPRCIRIEVRKGTLLAGPVQLEFLVPGDHGMDGRILSLRRLAALHRLGRFPRTLFPPEQRARRWARALQAWDGRKAGASHRDIAGALFGDRAVRRDWGGTSDYQRTQVKRLLETANMLIGGGWRKLL